MFCPRHERLVDFLLRANRVSSRGKCRNRRHEQQDSEPHANALAALGTEKR
jgi:hypothetical protein